jgi:hypothetical protein
MVMIKAVFGGMIFAAMAVSSQSGSASHQYVDRSAKGDRLLTAQSRLARPMPARSKLPAGCDAVVSPLAPKSDLTRVAARCDS